MLESLAGDVAEIARGMVAMQATLAALHASSAPSPFPQPVSWPPQPSNGLLTAEESSSPALLSTSPSLIPSFTTPSPVPPQQDSDGVFYGGVDGIQASAAQLQAVAYCLLARRQGQQHPIFKRRRPVVPTAAALQLTERKAIARASACKVFAAVRLQAAARGLLARRRLQKMRSPMHEATLAAVDLSIGERDLAWSVDLAWSDGHQQPRRPAVVFRRKHGVFFRGGRTPTLRHRRYGSSFPPCHRRGRTA